MYSVEAVFAGKAPVALETYRALTEAARVGVLVAGDDDETSDRRTHDQAGPKGSVGDRIASFLIHKNLPFGGCTGLLYRAYAVPGSTTIKCFR